VRYKKRPVTETVAIEPNSFFKTAKAACLGAAIKI
jgi:hypothetical protein